MAGWQEGHLAHKTPSFTNSRGSLPEQVEEEDPREEPADPGSPGKTATKRK